MVCCVVVITRHDGLLRLVIDGDPQRGVLSREFPDGLREVARHLGIFWFD